MTANQYGLIASLYLTGSILKFLPGILLDKYGPVPVSTMSLILTVLSHGAICQLAKLQPFPAQEYLLYVSFFCGGLSFAGSRAVAVSINMSNFHKSSHGKVTGMIGLTIFSSSAICSELYIRVLSPNLSDYFLIITVYSGMSCFLMVLFVRRVDKEEDYTILDSVPSTDGLLDADDKTSDNPWIKPELYILLIRSMIIGSQSSVLFFMISTFTESLGLRKYTEALITMSNVVAGVSILLIGFLLDCMVRRFIGLILIIAQTLTLFLAIFLIDHIQVLILLFLTTSVVFVIYDTLVPVDIYECFGDRHYGKILGLVYTSIGFATMALQYFMTWWFDHEWIAQDSPDEWCYGKKCFLPGLILIFILNVIAFSLVITFLYRRKSQWEKS